MNNKSVKDDGTGKKVKQEEKKGRKQKKELKHVNQNENKAENRKTKNPRQTH